MSEWSRIEAFARGHGMQAERGVEAGVIAARARPSFVVEVTVPDDVLEWFVTVRDGETGELRFSDWCDHYRVARDDDLQQERFDAVTALLLAVHGGVLRVIASRGSLAVPALEVRTTHGWQNVWELTG